MEDLDRKIRGLSKSKTARGIAKELGVKRKYVENIIKEHQDKRNKGWIASTAVALISIPLLVGGGYLYHKWVKENSSGIQYEKSLSLSETIEENKKHTISELIKAVKRLDDVNNDDPMHTRLLRDLEDSRKGRLNNIYDSYMKSYIPLEELIRVFESNYNVVSESETLTEYLDRAKMADGISKRYNQNRERFLGFMDKEWKSIYENIKDRDFESGGFIIKSGAIFKVEYRNDNKREEIRQYIKEIITGNPIHYKKLRDLTKTDYNHYGKDKTLNISALIDVYVLSDKLIKTIEPNDENKLYVKVLNWAKGNNKRIKPLLVALTHGSYDMNIYMKEVIRSRDVIAHWHSHPLLSNNPLINTLNRTDGLSNDDREVCKRDGNNLVMQFEQNGLRLYECRNDSGNITTGLVRTY